MIKTALFDFDGTLVNTDAAHHACWNLSLAQYGVSIDAPFFGAHCAGSLTPDIARHIKQVFPAVSASVEAFASEKDGRYVDWAESNTLPLMVGVREMLAFLAEKEIILGIVTGAPLTAIRKTLDQNGISGYFSTIVTRENISRGKPAPDGYLLGLERLGAVGQEAVAFEDTSSGVQAARAAAMTAIAVPQVYTLNHDFSAADFVCRDMFATKAVLMKMISLD